MTGKFWIQHRSADGELWTIGDEPFEGETKEKAFEEYLSQCGTDEKIQEYVISSADLPEQE